jgi:integrase
MTGVRIGETLALRWGRIDLLRGTLRVAETCYKGHFGSPKTRASRREVPLAAAVVRELKTSIRVQQNTLKTHWYSLETNAFRSRRTISEKRHYEPRARELVCNESIGILSVTRTAIVAFARNSFEGCTGSAWTLTYGDNFGAHR